MTNQWFRSWHGAPTDPKWLGIARKAGVPPGIVSALVWALLDRASQATERGSIEGYDADGLAYFMGCEPEQAESVIAILHEKGVLAENRFTGWDKHQPKREDNSADRVREFRERKKAPRNADVTQCNAMEREETLDTDTDTEQRESDAREEGDPKHWVEVQAILKDRADDLGDWEIDFLHSIKWKPSLSKAQADSLKGILDKLGARNAKPYALPTVKRGTPAYDAWIAYYRKRGPTAFYEKLDALTVPSEFPPQERAA